MAIVARNALSEGDIRELTAWRRCLHRQPELSGEEARTAQAVARILRDAVPDRLVTGLGGHGVAATYVGTKDGPSVLFRCEMDALPITEENPGLPHRSLVRGLAHLCGHDGHMAILAATARWLGRNGPTRGRVILLFQPAEEDGAGAARVIGDPQFASLAADYAFALHNLPGIPLGHAVISPGPAHCASRGMTVRLRGRTAHASMPETGLSPETALAQLITALPGLCTGLDPARPDFALATVTYAQLGDPGFGTTPGMAELHVTLRTQKDAGMAALVATAEAMVREAAGPLEVEISYHDIFRHCENSPVATELFLKALAAEEIPTLPARAPLRGSEDFGRFGDGAEAAMVLLGSGDLPALHNPDFDFPDALIPVGARIFTRLATDLCGC